MLSFTRRTVLRPLCRFTLGLLFGAIFTTMLCFFPFPKGKLYSFACLPLSLALAFMIQKYSDANVIMPYTFVRILNGKASFLQCLFVYVGMYVGASFVTGEFRFAIDTAPEEDQRHMELFMEKLFFGLNESISARLQQTLVVLGLFVALENWMARIVLYGLSTVWISTLPEVNPVLATAWFQRSKKVADTTDITRFYVNSIFAVSAAVISSKVGYKILEKIGMPMLKFAKSKFSKKVSSKSRKNAALKKVL